MVDLDVNDGRYKEPHTMKRSGEKGDPEGERVGKREELTRQSNGRNVARVPVMW